MNNNDYVLTEEDKIKIKAHEAAYKKTRDNYRAIVLITLILGVGSMLDNIIGPMGEGSSSIIGFGVFLVLILILNKAEFF